MFKGYFYKCTLSLTQMCQELQNRTQNRTSNFIDDLCGTSAFVKSSEIKCRSTYQRISSTNHDRHVTRLQFAQLIHTFGSPIGVLQRLARRPQRHEEPNQGGPSRRSVSPKKDIRDAVSSVVTVVPSGLHTIVRTQQ
jgi:hypothetical protein